MSLCTKSGQIACGTLGCRATSLCCQADIGYGCATGATCFTNSGSIGCWWTSSTMPVGPRPCYPYADGAALGNGCGSSASWCQVCSSTEYPYCFTNIILGGQIPLTAVSCDYTTGITSFTATAAGSSGSVGGGVTTTAPSTTRPHTSTPISTPSTTPSITPAPTPFSFPPQSPSTTPTSPPVSSSSSSSSGLSTGALAGIGIAALFAIAIIGLLAFFLWRKQRRVAPAADIVPPQPVMSPPPPGYPQYPPYADQPGYADQPSYGYPPPPPSMAMAKPPPPVEPRYEVPG